MTTTTTTTDPLTLETRRPRPLSDSVFSDLSSLVPLDGWWYWTDTTYHRVSEFGYPPGENEVPAEVFARLSGRFLWADCYCVYPSAAAAVADLRRVWDQK